ncbi:MAG: element excision factor XisH family protein [Bacteroidota bacterium]
MAARDLYHYHVIEALKKEGWIITHDPYTFNMGGVNFRMDIGAEKILAAEKDGKKIAVEVKSFIKNSPVQDLHEAVGKYDLYSIALDMQEPDRIIYLAIRLVTP